MRLPEQHDELSNLARLRADEADLDRQIDEARCDADRLVSEARATAAREQAAAREALGRELAARAAAAAEHRVAVAEETRTKTLRRLEEMARRGEERFEDAVALVIAAVGGVSP